MAEEEDPVPLEMRKCVHLLTNSLGTEVLISTNDKNDNIDKVIKEAERLMDKYKLRRSGD